MSKKRKAPPRRCERAKKRTTAPRRRKPDPDPDDVLLPPRTVETIVNEQRAEQCPRLNAMLAKALEDKGELVTRMGALREAMDAADVPGRPLPAAPPPRETLTDNEYTVLRALRDKRPRRVL